MFWQYNLNLVVFLLLVLSNVYIVSSKSKILNACEICKCAQTVYFVSNGALFSGHNGLMDCNVTNFKTPNSSAPFSSVYIPNGTFNGSIQAVSFAKSEGSLYKTAHFLNALQEPLKGIRLLSVMKNEISSLKGILTEDPVSLKPRAFPNLTHFWASNNNITTLETSILNPRFLPSLTCFDVSHNNVAVLPHSMFQDFPSLSDISLAFNRIGNISTDAFSNLPLLSSLKLNNNSIVSLPKGFINNCSSKTALGLDLDLSFNNIESTKDDFMLLSAHNSSIISTWNIHAINFQSNKMSAIPTFDVPSSSMSGPGVEKPNFEVLGFYTSISLILSRNAINDVNHLALKGLCHQYKLCYLYLDDNEIQYLPSKLFTDYELTLLDLSGNPIVYFPNDFNSKPNTIDNLNLNNTGLSYLPQNFHVSFDNLIENGHLSVGDSLECCRLNYENVEYLASVDNYVLNSSVCTISAAENELEPGKKATYKISSRELYENFSSMCPCQPKSAIFQNTENPNKQCLSNTKCVRGYKYNSKESEFQYDLYCVCPEGTVENNLIREYASTGYNDIVPELSESCLQKCSPDKETPCTDRGLKCASIASFMSQLGIATGGNVPYNRTDEVNVCYCGSSYPCSQIPHTKADDEDTFFHSIAFVILLALLITLFFLIIACIIVKGLLSEMSTTEGDERSSQGLGRDSFLYEEEYSTSEEAEHQEQSSRQAQVNQDLDVETYLFKLASIHEFTGEDEKVEARACLWDKVTVKGNDAGRMEAKKAERGSGIAGIDETYIIAIPPRSS
eukprot:Nk52_evm5s89 gene=Nk52_evmTU5s89